MLINFMLLDRAHKVVVLIRVEVGLLGNRVCIAIRGHRIFISSFNS